MDLASENGVAARTELAGVKIRDASNGKDARQFGDGVQLAHGGALDPRCRRVEAVDRRKTVHAMGVAHGEYPGVETRKSGALSGAHRVRLDSPPHASDQAWRLRAER